MIDFMYQLNGPRSTQVKHYFWVCLWKYFWIRLAGESVVSVNCPLQRGWASSNLLKAWIEQKVKKEEKLPLTFLLHCMTQNISSSFALGQGICTIGSPGSQAFGLGLSYIPPFLGLQLEDNRLWDFSASIIMWAKFLIINLHIFMFPISSVSLENLDYYLGQVI